VNRSDHHTERATRSDLAAVPVWVAENNVNSDSPLSTGYSNCTPSQLYVLDTRESRAFFTAYRPLVFSRFGNAGNESLYHFLYEGSLAYGEVNSANAKKTSPIGRIIGSITLSRGMEPPRAHCSTRPRARNPRRLSKSLPLNANNTVSLMVSNYATASTTDDNGTGAARTVFVNLAALGTFGSATRSRLQRLHAGRNGPRFCHHCAGFDTDAHLQ